MAGFTIDLVGRVKNFDLPKTQPLIPLYEAVVNSIYAIEERIDIKIIRKPQQVANIDGIDSSINEVIGFRQIVNSLINKSSFGYIDIIGKVGGNLTEYAGIKTVDLYG